ncbi:hypothetical protein F5B20DRAFT_582146 [Whalleya microplaca]|nr:hypothetical protein F5B20DRAFT_582146 [Whalleya microplaca]
MVVVAVLQGETSIRSRQFRGRLVDEDQYTGKDQRVALASAQFRLLQAWTALLQTHRAEHDLIGRAKDKKDSRRQYQQLTLERKTVDWNTHYLSLVNKLVLKDENCQLG